MAAMNPSSGSEKFSALLILLLTVWTTSTVKGIAACYYLYHMHLAYNSIIILFIHRLLPSKLGVSILKAICLPGATFSLQSDMYTLSGLLYMYIS